LALLDSNHSSLPFQGSRVQIDPLPPSLSVVHAAEDPAGDHRLNCPTETRRLHRTASTGSFRFGCRLAGAEEEDRRVGTTASRCPMPPRNRDRLSDSVNQLRLTLQLVLVSPALQRWRWGLVVESRIEGSHHSATVVNAVNDPGKRLEATVWARRAILFLRVDRSALRPRPTGGNRIANPGTTLIRQFAFWTRDSSSPSASFGTIEERWI
jgi:hypothetical protein